MTLMSLKHRETTSRATCGHWLSHFITKVTPVRPSASTINPLASSCGLNQGIGRIALTLAIEAIKQTPSVKEIEICYNPTNPVAKDFYSSFGFQEIGMDEDGEDMLALIKL